jgi:signal transduction histidine kinase/DNA-binding response OmpR family regulator
MSEPALIGRTVERRRLKAALADSDVGLIVIRGASGAGKTALVEDVLSDIAIDAAVIGRAKYPEGEVASGFTPILEALSQAVSSALDMLYDPVAGAQSLRHALGEQLSLLAEAGFVRPDGPATIDRGATASADGSAARINDAIHNLVRWLYGFGHPIVLFIDDWQRAPIEALSFLAIGTRAESDRLCTIILAERDAPQASSRDDLTHTETIDLGSLDPDARAALLGGAVGNPAAGRAILAWIGPTASGLPFDLLETARALMAGSAIVLQNGVPSFDAARAATIDRSEFVDVIMRRARELPEKVLLIGAAFALWGDRVRIAVVSDSLEGSVEGIQEALEILEREGILRTNGAEVIFVHDRMRRALLDSANPDLLRTIAVGMAQRIRTKPHLHEAIRSALQFRLVAGLADAQPAEWRDHFAQEAYVARTTGNATAAEMFAEAAWTLRCREAPVDGAADALILREASLAAAGRNEIEVLRNRIGEVLSRAETDEEIGMAYETAIVAATRAGAIELAWNWAREGLQRLGAQLPRAARKADLFRAIIRWRIAFLLPPGNPPARQHANSIDPLSRIVHFASVAAYSRDPIMALIMGLLAAVRARRLGYRSAYWRGRNILHFAALGNPGRASREAESLAADTVTTPFARAATLYRILYFGLIWTRPLATLRSRCTTIFDMAISEGDLVYAALSVRNALLIAWRTEPTLEGVSAAVREAEDKASRLRDSNALRGIRAFADAVRALQDPHGFDVADRAALWASPHTSPGSEAPIVGIELLGLRNAWSDVLAIAEQYEIARVSLSSHPGGVVWRFQESLARLKLGLKLRRNDLRYIDRAARLNPADHLGKLRILEAELLRRSGRESPCLEAYAVAVAAAASGSSRLEAGIAASCAADAARAFGRAELAAQYDLRAGEVWSAWGMATGTGEAPRQPDADSPLQQLADAEFRTAMAVRSERAKSRFLAEVSHELRTPLQGMQSLLDLAAETPAEFNLKEFSAVFGSLKSVVDDLTDLGALGGGAPLNPQTGDIVEVVASECLMASAMARQKNVAFVTTLPPQPIFSDFDSGRVRQVVRNLLSNAVRYTEHGEVKLQLAVDASRGSEGFAVSIAVEDSGPGLLDTELVQLFEPFRRGNRTRSEGHGLGLALSRRIAERMGGHLTAVNRPQIGACFMFSFVAQPPSQPLDSAVASAPLRILLVEDVPLSRRMIAKLLTHHGHLVTEATNGREALALHSRQQFDVVLIDVGLPDIDGLSVIETMSGLSGRDPSSIFVLTASTDIGLIERARRIGVAQILHKPITARDLLAVLGDTHIDDRRPMHMPDAEIGALNRQARHEILTRGHALIDRQWSRDALAREAHQLAGLSAQFGVTTMAAVFDRLDADARTGSDEQAGFAELRKALADFEELRWQC